mgnify:CR=1 FL=1
MIGARGGNYLVYFPSYEYMAQVLRMFSAEFPEIPVVAQKSGMTETEREDFLQRFLERLGRVRARVPVPVLPEADRHIAAGVPPELIDIATQRLAAINAAYETIARARGL